MVATHLPGVCLRKGYKTVLRCILKTLQNMFLFCICVRGGTGRRLLFRHDGDFGRGSSPGFENILLFADARRRLLY